MLKKFMVIVSIITLVVFGAIEVSANTTDEMTEAKLLLIDETKNQIEETNGLVEERGLDNTKYYTELGDIDERFGGLEIDIEQKLYMNGDLYILEYVCVYDYNNVEYDAEMVGIYSEPDGKWFSADDDYIDVISDRYPEAY